MFRALLHPRLSGRRAPLLAVPLLATRAIAEPLEDRRLLSATVSTLVASEPFGGSTVVNAGNVYELAAEAIYEIPAASHTLTTLATFKSLGVGVIHGMAVDGAGDLYFDRLRWNC
jgi:hypothetical protein